MAPKKKKKGKKKKINEVEVKVTRTQYLNMIAELNAVLAAVRKGTVGVEEVFLEVEKKWEQLQVDLEEVIMFIQSMITEKEEEIKMFEANIALLTEELIKQDEYYMAIISKMEDDYKETKRRLLSDLEFSQAKVKVMGEYKYNRDQWLERMAELDQILEHQEQRHREEVYEGEKYSIVKHHTNRNKMEEELEHLAVHMREATDYRLGRMSNNLIKKNIKLGNMLTCQQAVMTRLRKAFEDMQTTAKETQYSLELRNEEYNMILDQYLEKVNKIDALLQRHDELTAKIAELFGMVKVNRRLRRRILATECEVRVVLEEVEKVRGPANDKLQTHNQERNNYRRMQQLICNTELAFTNAANAVRDALDVDLEVRIIENTIKSKRRQMQNKEDYRETEKDIKFFEAKNIELEITKAKVFEDQEGLIIKIKPLLMEAELAQQGLPPKESKDLDQLSTYSKETILKMSILDSAITLEPNPAKERRYKKPVKIKAAKPQEEPPPQPVEEGEDKETREPKLE